MRSSTTSQSYLIPTNTRHVMVKSIKSPLLFAVGDGNHSLATAQEHIGKNLNQLLGWTILLDLLWLNWSICTILPSNLNPIHRVMFNVGDGFWLFGSQTFEPITKPKCKRLRRDESDGPGSIPGNMLGMLTNGGYRVVELTAPKSNRCVGSLQEFLDGYLKKIQTQRLITYTVMMSGETEPASGNVGFYFASLKKDNSLNRSSWMVPYPERPSRWDMPKISASTWKPVAL